MRSTATSVSRKPPSPRRSDHARTVPDPACGQGSHVRTSDLPARGRERFHPEETSRLIVDLRDGPHVLGPSLCLFRTFSCDSSRAMRSRPLDPLRLAAPQAGASLGLARRTAHDPDPREAVAAGEERQHRKGRGPLGCLVHVLSEEAHLPRRPVAQRPHRHHQGIADQRTPVAPDGDLRRPDDGSADRACPMRRAARCADDSHPCMLPDQGAKHVHAGVEVRLDVDLNAHSQKRT